MNDHNICDECGVENPPGEDICSNCGAKLVRKTSIAAPRAASSVPPVPGVPAAPGVKMPPAAPAVKLPPAAPPLD